MKMDFFQLLCVSICCYVYVDFCSADVEPPPLKKPEIYSLHIFSDIKYRYATTLVTSRVKNVHNYSREAIFDVELPNEAFITNLTLEIEGRIVVGEIKEKEAAKKQYEAAQQRGESAAYIGTKNRETNKFNLAVTVAAQSKISFNLTYQELLRRKNSQYEQVIYINPGQPVGDMNVTVAILESREITMLRVPPLRNDIGDNLADLSTLTVITQPSPKTGYVAFIPSLDEQLSQAASGMAGQFVVQYDVDRDMDAGDVLLVNGYFVHFFAPEGLEPIPHNVLFILDTSGSMSGRKITQLKSAMKSIIHQLIPGDQMNIMTFASNTNFWQYEMADVTDEDAIESSMVFVDSLIARGGTNIEMALREGLEFLNEGTLVDSTVRSPLIVFLTDGEATSGAQDTDKILEIVNELNENNIPIFALGFGEYADFDLIKKVALNNNGFGKKIYEASDASLQIVGFYNEIAVTLLNNITFEYLDKPQNVTKHVYANYFNGSEMIICGRYDDNFNETELRLRISASSSTNDHIILSGGFDNIIQVDDNLTNSGDFEEITEKVWAYLTIKQLLDKKISTGDANQSKTYTEEVLELSLKYGFVTPLTSMVVTIPTDLEEFQVVKPGEAKPKKEKIRNRGFYRTGYSQSSRIMGRSHDPGLMDSPGHIQYGMPGMSKPANYPQYIYKVHDDMGHDLSSIDTEATTQRMHTRTKQPHKQTDPNNKSKNKSKKDKKFSFPLIVSGLNSPPNGQEQLCLKLVTSKSQTSGVYLLHENVQGLRIEMQVDVTNGKKKKKGRKASGHLQEIRISSSETTETLTISKSSFTSPTTPADMGIWSITYNTPTNITLTLPYMSLTVYHLHTDELSLLVELDDSQRLDSNTGPGPIGVLDQILSANPTFISRQSQKKNKKVFIKTDPNRRTLLKSQLLLSIYSKYDQCVSFKKHEERLVNMDTAKLSDWSA